MPKKIRELKALLLKAGFTYRSGNGSHTIWSHLLLSDNIPLSGKDGSDAHHYQEKAIRNALKELEAILKKLEETEEK